MEGLVRETDWFPLRGDSGREASWRSFSEAPEGRSPYGERERRESPVSAIILFEVMIDIC